MVAQGHSWSVTHPKQPLLTHITPQCLCPPVRTSWGVWDSWGAECHSANVGGGGKAGQCCQALGGLWADHGVSCGRDSRYLCGRAASTSRRLDVLQAGPGATQMHVLQGLLSPMSETISFLGSQACQLAEDERLLAASSGKPGTQGPLWTIFLTTQDPVGS